MNSPHRGDSIGQGEPQHEHDLADFAPPFNFNWLQQIVVFNGADPRLLMACFLGGVIGLEREFKRRPPGFGPIC